MQWTRSTRTSAAERRRGFTLVELLLTMSLVGITLATALKFFSSHARYQRQTALRIETQQALRGSLDAITRDLRLAGACIPTGIGNNIAFEGEDGDDGAPDAVTIRTGLVRDNMSCISEALTAAAAIGSTTLNVQSTSGFAPGMYLYLSHPVGGGQFAHVVSTSATAITIDDPVAIWDANGFPASSGVFAVDERRYELNTSEDPPLLVLTVNGGDPQAFAAGIRDLQLRFVLSRNCPPCDVVDRPADAAEIALINEVIVTGEAETISPVRPEDDVVLNMESRAKPRNLLP